MVETTEGKTRSVSGGAPWCGGGGGVQGNTLEGGGYLVPLLRLKGSLSWETHHRKTHRDELGTPYQVKVRL